eukprot:6230646-Alexandrium_andersonii.AAC.1
MSASLVGSEMCIRDSRTDVQIAASPGAPVTFIDVVVAATPHVESGAWAVSYTHLTLPTICSV